MLQAGDEQLLSLARECKAIPPTAVSSKDCTIQQIKPQSSLFSQSLICSCHNMSGRPESVRILDLTMRRYSRKTQYRTSSGLFRASHLPSRFHAFPFQPSIVCPPFIYYLDSLKRDPNTSRLYQHPSRIDKDHSAKPARCRGRALAPMGSRSANQRSTKGRAVN